MVETQEEFNKRWHTCKVCGIKARNLPMWRNLPLFRWNKKYL